MLKTLTRAFFIKIYYWNLKLSTVILLSVIIVLLKNEKEPPKRCEPPKKIMKIFNMARDTGKTLKRGKNGK